MHSSLQLLTLAFPAVLFTASCGGGAVPTAESPTKAAEPPTQPDTSREDKPRASHQTAKSATEPAAEAPPSRARPPSSHPPLLKSHCSEGWRRRSRTFSGSSRSLSLVIHEAHSLERVLGNLPDIPEQRRETQLRLAYLYHELGVGHAQASRTHEHRGNEHPAAKAQEQATAAFTQAAHDGELALKLPSGQNEALSAVLLDALFSLGHYAQVVRHAARLQKKWPDSRDFYRAALFSARSQHALNEEAGRAAYAAIPVPSSESSKGQQLEAKRLLPFFVASRCYLADIAESKGNIEEAKRALREVTAWTEPRTANTRDPNSPSRQPRFDAIERRLRTLKDQND